MRKKILLLLSLCLIAAPAWAADAAGAPPAEKSSAQAAAPAAQPTKKAPKKAKKKTAKAAAEPAGCPTGCSLMHCPPPTGPTMCCNTSTYQPC